MGSEQSRALLGALSDGFRERPLRAALLAQAAATLGVAVPVLLWFPVLLGQPLLLALLQGGLAGLLAAWRRAPWWWLAIHLGFVPLVVVAYGLGLPSWVWPAGLVCLLLVFWRTDRSRVPLFLSSRQAAESLQELLPRRACSVVDLGCGDGAVLRYLARRRKDCRFVGIEHAPLPWLWARLAARGLPNVEIRFGDFWKSRLGGFDVVFAFLSPAPMPSLWQKAVAELSDDALLVSSSFPVPGQAEIERIAVNDRLMTYFYVYRPGRQAI